MADAKTINGYNLKDAAAREAIANLNTVKLASEGGASGSIRFGVDGEGNYGYYKAGADTVTPFSSGGDFEETVLWTNPSPTNAFSGQRLTGLSDLSQYDYIGFYCRVSTSIATETFEIMPYDYFKNTVGSGSRPVCGVSYIDTDKLHTRAFYYDSDTAMQVRENLYIQFYPTTGGVDNSSLIPTKIVGIKKGKQGLPDKYRLIRTGTTGTITFDRDYDQLLVIAWGGGSTSTYVQVNGVTQVNMGLNNYYQTDVTIFDYKAGTPIYIVTDPSGYKIFEIYKE